VTRRVKRDAAPSLRFDAAAVISVKECVTVGQLVTRCQHHSWRAACLGEA
jgi:hypothetical protein